jgi:hypothetical protein
LTVNKVTLKFDGRIIFRQYIPRKMQQFGIKIYKLCDSLGYSYDMRVYLGKDIETTTWDILATHYTVRNLNHKLQVAGYKVFMDSFFSPLLLRDELLCKIMREVSKPHNLNSGFVHIALSI